MIRWGLESSFKHEANGMTWEDMVASQQVANTLGEVIIFRSSGPWCKRWIEWGHPTKNFHVKGKSSDWGPHAGLVPYEGVYSKVGADAVKAKKGTAANDDGLASGFAGKVHLALTRAQIDRQASDPEGGRKAIESVVPRLGHGSDLLLHCRRSGSGSTPITFIASAKPGTDLFMIYVDTAAQTGNPPGSAYAAFEVMTSNEVGAMNMPLTGDYDLMSVCPPWGQYGSRLASKLYKPGIKLNNGAVHKSQFFHHGVGMDNVLDPRFHTMGRSTPNAHLPLAPRGMAPRVDGAGKAVERVANLSDFRDRQRHYQQGSGFSSASLNVAFDQSGDKEHADMGNLTPRILRCIQSLNAAMAGPEAMRRVHHNAESHRNRAWGGLSETDMVTKKDGDKFGDGFPLTAFHPVSIRQRRKQADGTLGPAPYFQQTTCTIESLAEFRTYAAQLKEAGYYVPKSWIWNL